MSGRRLSEAGRAALLARMASYDNEGRVLKPTEFDVAGMRLRADEQESLGYYDTARILRETADAEQARQSREMSHADYAEKFPPRDGYQCTTDPKGDTNGGGCFNCGWKGARS